MERFGLALNACTTMPDQFPVSLHFATHDAFVKVFGWNVPRLGPFSAGQTASWASSGQIGFRISEKLQTSPSFCTCPV